MLTVYVSEYIITGFQQVRFLAIEILALSVRITASNYEAVFRASQHLRQVLWTHSGGPHSFGSAQCPALTAASPLPLFFFPASLSRPHHPALYSGSFFLLLAYHFPSHVLTLILSKSPFVFILGKPIVVTGKTQWIPGRLLLSLVSEKWEKGCLGADCCPLLEGVLWRLRGAASHNTEFQLCSC